jgi:colicin import membrane protein
MTNELVVINPQEYGIEESKANELMGNLPQILSERSELEKQFADVIKLDINSPVTAKVAAELRKLVKKNRTQGIEVWHKTSKDYFLKGGQFVDAIKRKENAVNERMEADLEAIEKYAEIQEAKRITELTAERMAIIEPLTESSELYKSVLGTMNQESFDNLVNDFKLTIKAKKDEAERIEKERIEAEKKAEAERLELERLNKLENERKLGVAPFQQFFDISEWDFRTISDEQYSLLIADLRKKKVANDELIAKQAEENARLKVEAEAKEKALAEERAKQEALRKAEQEKADKLLEQQRAEAQKKLKAEQEAKAKIEAELKAKKDAEAKAEAERKAEEEKARKEAEKLAKAPIKKQLNAWVDSFVIPTFIDSNNATAILISDRANRMLEWAKSEIEKL